MPQSSTQQEPIYELKHRIAGAVILVSAAVLVIPLLLSDPGLEANSSESSTSGSDNTFRSRIVPLDITNVNQPAGSSGEELSLTTLGDNRPALLDLTAKTTVDPPKDMAPTIKPVDLSATDSPSPALILDQAKNATSKSAEDEKPSIENVARTGANEQALGNGWVVRVGTFSRPANVESVSKLLSSSGFEPRTTSVMTSLGESTRVWLGPYSERETADKISDRLKSLIGEKGYVTRTSS